MASIARTVLFAWLGGMLGALWTLAVGLAGAPGAFIAGNLRQAGGIRSGAGLLLCVVGQTYAALTFSAVVVRSAQTLLADADGLWKWIAWSLAFFVAAIPVAFAQKDSQTENNPNAQHLATGWSGFCWLVGHVAFLLDPSLISPVWDWVPHL